MIRDSDWLYDAHPIMRMLYILSVWLSMISSCMATAVAIRTILMVNLAPAFDTPLLLAKLDAKRPVLFASASNLLKFSFAALLVPPSCASLVTYEWYESILCVLLVVLAACFLGWEDHSHHEASRMVARIRRKERERRNAQNTRAAPLSRATSQASSFSGRKAGDLSDD